MRKIIAAGAMLCTATQAGAGCLLTKENVDKLYNGAAMSSVEFHTGCEPELISRNGYGNAAIVMFQIVDPRGSILVMTANGAERMTGYSVQFAR